MPPTQGLNTAAGRRGKVLGEQQRGWKECVVWGRSCVCVNRAIPATQSPTCLHTHEHALLSHYSSEFKAASQSFSLLKTQEKVIKSKILQRSTAAEKHLVEDKTQLTRDKLCWQDNRHSNDLFNSDHHNQIFIIAWKLKKNVWKIIKLYIKRDDKSKQQVHFYF